MTRSHLVQDLSGGTRRVLVGFGLFLCFGSLVSVLAGLTLVRPGMALDKIWLLNPQAYTRLASFGKAAGIGFLLLGAIMVLAAAGWFRRSLWGWRMSVAIIAVQVLGDLANFLRGDFVAGATGCVVAGALLLCLSRPKIRSYFGTNTKAKS